jgi:hypothetical protein
MSGARANKEGKNPQNITHTIAVIVQMVTLTQSLDDLDTYKSHFLGKRTRNV